MATTHTADGAQSSAPSQLQESASDSQVASDSPQAASQLPNRRVRSQSSWFGRTFESLSYREYRLMWIGMFLSMGGFNMLMLARGILVYDITDQDPVISAMVSIGWAPGLLVVSLFGGVLGDRMDRKVLIQISQFANASLALMVAILILTNVVEWYHLLAVSLTQGCLFALQVPARTAAISQLVPKGQITNAIALNTTAMTLMSLAAPAVGGVLYETIEPEGVYFTVTAMMCGALFFTSLLPSLKPEGTIVKEPTLKSIQHGFGYIMQHRVILLLLIQAVVIAMLSMPFRMLVPVFAKELYGSEPSEVGWLAMMAGVGGIAASVGVAGLKQGQYRGWVLLLSPLISGIAMLVLGVFQLYYVGMLMFVGVGFGETIRWALGQALVIEQSDNAYRARMTSVTMMTYGVVPIAALPIGALLQNMGPTVTVIGMASTLIVAGAFFLLISRSIRRL